ncbi:GTP-binding protein GTR1 [Rhodotorula toruloides]|uniref:GTP-binding protein n=1 Tax=Rhodotorula toruloides TaxID=5286 RepID=A0A0K3CM46_RHOTO|nr:GTP-binding protein GTR1 [Rhodotorula toruloides]
MSSKSRKKVLLMGKSGSGKTSMRAIIFKSQLAADTRRLGATIDVESSQIKFLGGLRLDLWDCGGQDSFMDSHLTAQSSTVFRSVHSLIYIFDAESPELLTSDTAYFLKCLRTLRDQNPPSTSSSGSSGEDGGPTVFVLLHKMDLVPVDMQASKLAEFEAEVTKKARESGYQGGLQFYGTSIWNETLYKAWSIVMSHLMPSLSSLRTHLSHFLSLSSASEVVLFERTTFLVISSVTNEQEVHDTEWDERRFERISTMVKAFKLGCSKIRSPFSSLVVSTQHYTAVLDSLTPETYILVIARGEIQPAAIELNIRLARPHFGKLEAIGMAR